MTVRRLIAACIVVVSWHPEGHARQGNRSSPGDQCTVIRQHPVMVFFALSPVLAALGVMWWLAGAGWAIVAALVLVVVGGAMIVLKR